MRERSAGTEMKGVCKHSSVEMVQRRGRHRQSCDEHLQTVVDVETGGFCAGSGWLLFGVKKDIRVPLEQS